MFAYVECTLRCNWGFRSFLKGCFLIWKRIFTCLRVSPLAPGVSMARPVERLKGENTRFWDFVKSLNNKLPNVFAPFVTNFIPFVTNFTWDFERLGQSSSSELLNFLSFHWFTSANLLVVRSSGIKKIVSKMGYRVTQGGIQGDHKVTPCISHLEMRTHLLAMSCILLRVSLGFLDWVFPCCSCSRPLMFPCGENILGASLCTCQCHLLQSCLFLSSTFLFHCFCGVDDNLFC